MLSDRLELAPAATRAECTDTFVLAAMAFLLEGDWRKQFRPLALSGSPIKRKFGKLWLAQPDAKMLTAIDKFLEVLP